MSLEAFISDPAGNVEASEGFRKEEWKDLARHYGVEVSSNARKLEIKEAVMAHLRNSGLVHDVVEIEGENGGRGSERDQGKEDVEIRS